MISAQFIWSYTLYITIYIFDTIYPSDTAMYNQKEKHAAVVDRLYRRFVVVGFYAFAVVIAVFCV